MPKQAKSFKCEVMKVSNLPDVRWAATLGRNGFWENKINLLRGDPEAALKINADDQSTLTQLRTKAKKVGVTLLFARAGESVLVRAYVPSEAVNRLVLLLREPRTMNDLRVAKLELNLESEVQSLIAHGHAHHRSGKYQLTDRGQEELADRVA